MASALMLAHSVATSWSQCVGWRRAAGTYDRLCPQVPLKKWLAIAHANPAESLAGYSLHGSAEVARAVYTNGTGLMYIYLHVSG